MSKKKTQEQRGMNYEIEFDGRPAFRGWSANERSVFEMAAKLMVRYAEKKPSKSMQLRVWPATVISTKKGKKGWSCSVPPGPSWDEVNPPRPSILDRPCPS
jgi:hypothetical protein